MYRLNEEQQRIVTNAAAVAGRDLAPRAADVDREGAFPKDSIAEMALRSCGGAAFGGAHGVERLFRDARAPIVMPPSSDVAYEFIGRALCGMEVFG